MKKSFFRVSVIGLFAAGLIVASLGMAEAKGIFGPCQTSKKCDGKPGAVASIGSMKLVGKTASSLKGRVYAHWADNPAGEILLGIQYWNTTDPGETGDPLGRASDDRNPVIPDPLFACCAWGFQGGEAKNSPFAGWYNPQTTVRLKVKDSSLMKQLMAAAQKFVAVEVQLSGGNTVTSFKVLQ
jgi:hypothetical protein